MSRRENPYDNANLRVVSEDLKYERDGQNTGRKSQVHDFVLNLSVK
jgi:hypothetical protein